MQRFVAGAPFTYNRGMTTQPFEIIAAVPQDSRAIGALRAANWYEQYSAVKDIDTAWLETEMVRLQSPKLTAVRAKWIAEAAKPGATNFWRVARLVGNHSIVGFIEGREHGSGQQELHSIHVAKDHRKQRIGQALLYAAHGWFDAQYPIFLDVGRDNERAQAFYKRNGYEPRKKFMYGALPMLRMQRPANYRG
jgi:ribosomal protein S18 acetylase RimI-like enzyme